jgi:hypothetical protein
MTTQYTKNFAFAMPDFRSGPWHDLINGTIASIDSLLYSAMSQVNVNGWANSTDYTVGVDVIDETDASVWMCAKAHKSADAPATFLDDRTAHPDYWARLLTGFAPRGEWAQNTNYFPYDLTYDSARGIMALCQTKHTSTSTGSIVDDQMYWAFLLDMSDVAAMIASAVSYSNASSGIPKTNVQDAIDYIETQIVALDNVNIAQHDAIVANTDDIATNTSDIAALKVLTVYTTALEAPYFIAHQTVTCQFGGSAAVGVYADATSLALRAPGNNPIFFQNGGGTVNYGKFDNTGLHVTGVVAATGLVSGTAFQGGSATLTGGALYAYGWSGNNNISVIFLNSAQNKYIYNDGTNLSFVGFAGVYAANGRLWGASDFSAVPVSNGRLVYAGDWVPDWYTLGNMGEPYSGAVMTGAGASASQNPWYRFRYMQLYTTGWFTVGYA